MMYLISLTSAAADGKNLIRNSGFEEIDSDGMPIYWSSDAYRINDVGLRFAIENIGYTGYRSALIEVENANDARFVQNVAVEPESLYLLSGYIKTDYMPDVGMGANISVGGIAYDIQGFIDTEGEWKKFEVYGETGEDQTSLSIFVRIGGYNGESSGMALFDNISLVKVDALPDEVVATLWYQSEITQSEVYITPTIVEKEAPFTLWLVVIAILFLLVMFLCILYISRDTADCLTKVHQSNTHIPFIAGIALALFGRLIIAYVVPGYSVDINCFLSWGGTFALHGAEDFFANTSFCDYTPGYLYILGLNGMLFGSDKQLNILIIKLFPIMCDVLTALIIYMVGKKHLRHSTALALSLLYALNPTSILISAGWGQIDSVLTLLLLLVVVFAVNHRWMVALPIYFVAVLLKPQALMFGPLGLIALVADCIKDKKLIKHSILGILLGVLAALVILLPFNGHFIVPDDSSIPLPIEGTVWQRFNFSELFAQYSKTLTSYPHVTVNTANIYYLFGLNWTPIKEQVSNEVVITLLSVYMLLAVGGCVFAYIKKKDTRPFQIHLLFAISLLIIYVLINPTITYEHMGYCLMGIIFVVVLMQFIRSRKMHMVPLAGGILLLLLYVFGIKMHERYLFPALALFSLAYIYTKDIRLLILIAIITFTSFVNTGILLDRSIRLGSTEAHLLSDTHTIAMVLSLINVIAGFFAIYLGHSIMSNGKVLQGLRLTFFSVKATNFDEGINLDPHEEALLCPKGNKLCMRKRDYVIMLVVTVLYAMLALSNLGSTKAPQTTYVSEKPNEEIVFDLGQEMTFRMLYFAQVSYDNFLVQISTDNQNWSETYMAQMSQGECFRWKYLTHCQQVNGTDTFTSSRLELTGRYIKIIPNQDRLKLNEVIFTDLEGMHLPVWAVTESAERLIDEQDTLTGEPSWYNSTYFDEIYHARAAFDHTLAFDSNAIADKQAYHEDLKPYEYSHPPLGKYIMSWFISLFGMTPFGWRFAGALMGIFMLPAMYLLGKQLFKKTIFATAGMLLMALDCMHLTQTRIATIDSFPVLFIILAYFFMLRYIQDDIWSKPLLKTFIPLFFSGIFMGLAIASKWIGIYAGVGLALLFFYSCYQHLRQWQKAQQYEPQDTRRHAIAKARYYGLRSVVLTCLACVVFFIVIPLLIYVLSYIPYFHAVGGVSIERLITETEGMLRYHSTPRLGMDHPFYSPWWEWPLILQPMYYASDNYVPQGYAYSIFAVGNPAIWWVGSFAFILVVIVLIKRHVYRTQDGRIFHVKTKYYNNIYLFITIGLLSQYLPWVLVPRGTYIYHFFASVPFIILAIVACFRLICNKTMKVGKIILWSYIALCAICFAILYPYASGITVPTGWLDFAKNLMIERNIYY